MSHLFVLFLIIVCVVAWLSPAQARRPPPPPPVTCATITAIPDGFLNLRVGPTSASPVIALLYPGTLVLVDGFRVGGWFHVIGVEGAPADGWIYGQWFRFSDCQTAA
jgi:hypothetical protein